MPRKGGAEPRTQLRVVERRVESVAKVLIGGLCMFFREAGVERGVVAEQDVLRVKTAAGAFA